MAVLAESPFLERRVEGQGDPDRRAFRELYASAARMEDFAWVYHGADIEGELWRGNADHCIQTIRPEEPTVKVKKQEAPMLGIACCHPLTADVEPKLHQWIGLHQLPCDPEHAVVISCLLVRPEARGQRHAMSLGFDCLRWAWTQNRDAGKGYTHFLIQASAEVARRPQGLIRRIGAITAAKLGNGQPDTNHIVLHSGLIKDALAGDECGEH